MGTLTQTTAQVQDILNQYVNVKTFGAKGDGVTDDTVAIRNAIDEAKKSGARCLFPTGIYRVTSGYTQSVDYNNVYMEGSSSARETSTQTGTIIRLDSTDPDSFFYSATAAHRLQVKSIQFQCKQFVQDRDFFKFSASGLSLNFEDIDFEEVEKPFAFKIGCYFQMGYFKDIQFRKSGMFHSESSEIKGTLMILDNIHHEEMVPVNTELIVCNLQGIRMIRANNFLIEGSLPSGGWTVLKFNNAWDSGWTRFPNAQITNFYTIWTGDNAPTYVVNQISGSVEFTGFNNIPTGSKYKISSQGIVKISDASFTGTVYKPSDVFEIEDYSSLVIFNGLRVRDIDLSDNGILYRDTQLSQTGETETLGSTLISNDMSTVLFKWDGGYIDGADGVIEPLGGTTYTPSLDATYGRKLIITPGTELIVHISALMKSTIRQYDQINVAVLFKLPVFSSGFIQLGSIEDAVVTFNLHNYNTDYSGQLIYASFPFRINGTPSSVGIRFSPYDECVIDSGNLEIYSIALYSGNGVPRFEYPRYPKNIQTHNTAAPTGGAWVAGDICYNSEPSAGGSVGWVCVTSGTPGTWKGFGVIEN